VKTQNLKSYLTNFENLIFYTSGIFAQSE